MSSISIDISKDKLNAEITISTEGNRFPSGSEINKAIREAGVTVGIDSELLERINAEKCDVEKTVFAKGKPFKKGDESKLIWFVDLNTSLKPTITERGKVDFKHLKQCEPVEKGQELVSKLPPAQGISGRTVTGESIYSAGKDLPLPAGKNTMESKDGLTLYAAIDGHAFWKSGKVHIDNVYHIKGDVDFSTGNVRFDGTVVIDGDVRSGFRVEATDTIHIGGNVEAAEIYSHNGDVSIQLGIVGRGKAKVLANGSLRCGFIQDANIGVGKDVIIERYSINSNITSGANVLLQNNEALIRGGRVVADQSIEANEIGSDRNIRTEVGIIGTESDEFDSKRWNIKKDKDLLMLRYSTLIKRMEFLSLLEQRLPELSSEKKEELALTAKQIKENEKQIDDIEKLESALVQKRGDRDYPRAIVIKDKLHRGVMIKVGNNRHFNDRLIQAVRIYQNNDAIRIDKLHVKGEKDNAIG